HRCPYCRADYRTSQGLRSHLAQSRECRIKHFEKYAADSSDDTDSGSDSECTGSEADLGPGLGELDVDMDLAGPEDPSFGDDLEGSDEETINLPAASDTREDTTTKRPHATVEEVADDDDDWVQPFPEEQAAGATYAECRTQFERMRDEQKQGNLEPWHPFESEEEWELAHWMMTSGISQTKTESFLKLRKVRQGINPSFHNNRSFLKRIDALPEGPKWTCYPFELTGDELDAEGQKKTEIVEMWCRDPVECVRELLQNPSFTNQAYEPIRLFKRFEDGKYSNREYNEMWTADWWWEIQKRLPIGSTLAPIIIASDKTQLTRFSGDKEAWPVYLTIAAGHDGEKMDCADGFVRKIFPILAAYIADYPEQCLVACTMENPCPGCSCGPKKHGDTDHYPWRDPTETVRVLSEQAAGDYPVEFVDQWMRPINPFWEDLPHCDIFRCMTPDLLHELHNGAFGDHTVKWATKATSGGENEIDQRFRAMTPHPTLRHFKKGISLTTQWTGKERKNMEKVFLGVLADATDPAVQLAARGMLDFIHYAHFETHCDESLAQLDFAWSAFHTNKDIFIKLGIRKHFNISKIHKLKHYVDHIRSRGTADGFNTEGTERLHIDLAKVSYNATNKKAYTRQMTVWLRRQESVHKFGTYLQWAAPGYLASINAPVDEGEEEEESDAADPEPEADDDDEDETVAINLVPTFKIAKTPGFPNLTAASIMTNFHAPGFLLEITRFLQSKSLVPHFIPGDNTAFAVYKRFSVPLPRITAVGPTIVQDAIRAVKGHPSKVTPRGIVPENAGQFDTVLVRTHPQIDGPTDGLCVVRVRVIFRLPEAMVSYSEPLLYVDWFKPLQRPDPHLGMHRVSLSSRNHHQKSSIIPIGDVVRSCHLIPVFGRVADRTWTSETVLDKAKRFYLNPYLRHHDFYLFRYQVALHASKKAAEERRVRMRVLGRAG
ncbi:hypothetical protein C8R43DRAFT_1148665, partial [Mycena crocata]